MSSAPSAPGLREKGFKHAGLMRRSLAYLIDIIPITLGIFLVVYVFTDFKTIFHQILAGHKDVHTRLAFQGWKLLIRNSAFVVFTIYCTLLECSGLQGSIGKYVLGIKVVNYRLERLTPAQAIYRNCAKLMVYVTALLSFLILIFTQHQQALHDKVAKTYVVVRIPPTVLKPAEQVLKMP